jgi:L-lysine 2,3-aminomutase
MLRTIPVTHTFTWQETLSNLLTDPQELLNILKLDAEQTNLSLAALKDFPLRIPRPYLSRIKPGNPNDPLLLQVLPKLQESMGYPGFSTDPLSENNVNPKPGLLHKYQGRALLIPTSSCAIHCRYCFRRHFPYDNNRPSKNQWQDSLQYLADNNSISEVILSGGDPLTLSDRHLDWLVTELGAIPHLRRLRIHTRLPIMIPQRITSGLCELLSRQRLDTVVILHSNHAQEFDTEVDAACLRLKQSGASLLNQSVLLKNINDSSSTLITLSERLFQAGIIPYYLHLLDKVEGAGHFEVSEGKGLSLMQEIQKKLPGYLVPRLVREVSGQSSKTLIHDTSGS